MSPSSFRLKPSELRSNRFFADLSEREVVDLLKVCSSHIYGPGEYVLREKEKSRDIFVILSGTVRIGRELYAGDEKELDTLGPGEFFGEMAFLDGSPRSAHASCLEETTLFRIDKEAFDRLAARRPSAAYKISMKIASALAERLRASNDLVESIFSNPNKTILELKTRLLKIQAMMMRR